MRILGVDPSLTSTGLATVDGGCDSIKTNPRDWPDDLQRLRYIAHTILGRAFSANVDVVVMEGLAFASRTGKASDRAGLHWLIRDRLERRYPVVIVPPTTRAKYATGKGNAGKDAVLIAVVQRFPIYVSDNNEADAVVLLAMGLDHYGTPLAAVPAVNRTALQAVTWPEIETS